MQKVKLPKYLVAFDAGPPVCGDVAKFAGDLNQVAEHIHDDGARSEDRYLVIDL